MLKSPKQVYNMKIVCISDTHNDYHRLEIPDGDILIHAGDIDAFSLSSELTDFNLWMASLPHKHKIVVAGNHDSYIDTTPLNVVRTHLHSVHYLENSGCEIDCIKIWGSPVTPMFNNWSYMSERGQEINEFWQMIPDDTNILITHGPAYGILDRTFFPREEHVGCKDLLNRINEIKPKLHIFGHIHPDYGQTKINGTTFVNASMMNNEYRLANKPIVIEYEF